jgi:hypothetical protein
MISNSAVLVDNSFDVTTTEVMRSEKKREYNPVSRREYYISHREEAKAQSKAYHAAHREEAKACSKAYHALHPGQDTIRNHLSGKCRPMSEAKDCSMYLGVYVAERALSRFFDHIERMPMCNPGFDFLCGRGYKIDVKSACLREQSRGSAKWQFYIGRNEAADYFLCLAFDNRENLEPKYVWLIPGKIVNNHALISISDTEKSRARFSAYLQPLDRVNACCEQMRGGEKVGAF